MLLGEASRCSSQILHLADVSPRDAWRLHCGHDQERRGNRPCSPAPRRTRSDRSRPIRGRRGPAKGSRTGGRGARRDAMIGRPGACARDPARRRTRRSSTSPGPRSNAPARAGSSPASTPSGSCSCSRPMPPCSRPPIRPVGPRNGSRRANSGRSGWRREPRPRTLSPTRRRGRSASRRGSARSTPACPISTAGFGTSFGADWQRPSRRATPSGTRPARGWSTRRRPRSGARSGPSARLLTAVRDGPTVHSSASPGSTSSSRPTGGSRRCPRIFARTSDRSSAGRSRRTSCHRTARWRIDGSFSAERSTPTIV